MSQIMQSSYLRPIGYLLPVLGAIGALALVVPKYLALRADEAAFAEVQRDAQLRTVSLDTLRQQPTSVVVARVPATREEPVEFLRNLNRVVALCGVRLTRMTEAPPPPDPAASATPQDKAAEAAGKLPEGTRQVTLDVTAEGSYQGIAVFFARLETYPRLISLSKVTMKAEKFPALSAHFQLSRYVDSAAPAPAAASDGGRPSPLSTVVSGQRERAGQTLPQTGQP